MRASFNESSSPFGPKARPMIAVIINGRARLSNHGHGLRSVRRKSLAIRIPSVFISFAKFAAGQLQENVVETGAFEHDVFGGNRELQKIAQAIGGIALAEGGDGNLARSLLDETKFVGEAGPIFGNGVVEF